MEHCCEAIMMASWPGGVIKSSSRRPCLTKLDETLVRQGIYCYSSPTSWDFLLFSFHLKAYQLCCLNRFFFLFLPCCIKTKHIFTLLWTSKKICSLCLSSSFHTPFICASFLINLWMFLNSLNLTCPLWVCAKWHGWKISMLGVDSVVNLCAKGLPTTCRVHKELTDTFFHCMCY